MREDEGMGAHRVARALRTAVHLRPEQVFHRVRLSARRAMWSRMGPRIDARYRARAAELPRARLDLPGLERVAGLRAQRSSRDESDRVARDALDGRFTFLGVTRELGPEVDWYRADLDTGTRLWKTLLHEFPFALDLARAAADGDSRFATRLLTLARSWSAASPIARPGFALDAWNARAVATRLVNWAVAASVLGLSPEDGDGAFLSDAIAVHGLFLRDNLELDLGANHLLRDAVGLVFAHELCGAAPDALDLLEQQVREQILPDGCHYERVPLYHAVVLQDLVEVRAFLGSRSPGWLDRAVGSMAAFLAHLLPECGRLPLLGDTWLGETDGPRLLEEAGAPAAAPDPALVAPHSGLVVLRAGKLHAVVRAGPHGPDSQLGHAHADGLSFELHHGSRKLVTDTGTGTYDAGPIRSRTRSTAAHNTVQLDGEEQLEAWGSFRVGRRGRGRVLAQGSAGGWSWVSAAHDGYRWLPGRPVHHRWLGLHESAALVLDVVLGANRHQIRSAIHLHPEGAAARITALGGASPEIPAPLHERFNETQESTEVYVEATARLPWAGGWWIAPKGGEAGAELRFEEGTLVAICRHSDHAIEVRWRPEAHGNDAVLLCPLTASSAT